MTKLRPEMADAPERIWIDGARKDQHWESSEGECLSPHGPYIHHATVAAREERYDARIDALVAERDAARESAEQREREASTTCRALEIVLSRCKLPDPTARELKYHLVLWRRRTGTEEGR